MPELRRFGTNQYHRNENILKSHFINYIFIIVDYLNIKKTPGITKQSKTWFCLIPLVIGTFLIFSFCIG